MSPDRFREELKRFDRSLDFEFNGRKGRWEIVGTDRKNKKYLIAKIPLGEIGTIGVDMIKTLFDCSPKHHTAKKLNERIDRIKEEEDAQQEKLERDTIQSLHEDAWAHLQYKNGYRVSFANVGGGEEKVSITDRRRFVNEVEKNGN